MTDILTLPHDAIAARVWAGTAYAYPNIELLIAELTNLRARVAELERENQTQRDMMQGKDDAIAELSFTVKELEAQVAARDEAVRVVAELYLARHDACESAHGLNLFASPAVLTRLVHAMEAASGNPIATAAYNDAKNKERP